MMERQAPESKCDKALFNSSTLGYFDLKQVVADTLMAKRDSQPEESSQVFYCIIGGERNMCIKYKTIVVAP